MKRKEWLPHLETSIPEEARGYTVSMYSMALEGWRRGLRLNFINENRRKSEIRYSLAFKDKEHQFVVSRGDLTSSSIMKICRDKQTTKEYLSKAGVPTPEGKLFGEQILDEDIVSYAKSLDFPLVIKPSNGTGGKGVIANIKDESEFRKALSYVKYDLKYSEVIVEKFFEGTDHRIYVVGDKVVGAFIRIPANVVGDGKRTVRQLLKVKKDERDKNPALFNRPIKIDKEMHSMLAEEEYKLDSVPKEGERVFLKSKGNVSSGGDSLDVTDELTDEVKHIAIRAVAAIPGLKHSGVDIIVDKQKNKGIILEINTQASLNSHLFPMEGQARDIPKAIIDYYFPETISNYEKGKTLYYFDLQNMFEAFESGHASEYVVPPMPTGEVSSTRFIVSGKLRNVGYEVWIRRQARNLNLNGYIKNLLNGKTSIIVSGNNDNINKFRKIINNKASIRAEVLSVQERSRKSSIKIGFEILGLDGENIGDVMKPVQHTERNIQEGYFPVKIDDVRVRKRKVLKK